MTYSQTYNDENRMSEMKVIGGTCSSPGTPTSKWWSFTYDGDGCGLCTPERSERGHKVKQVYHPNASTTVTTEYYAGGSYEVEQTNDATEVVRQYYSIARLNVGMKEGRTMSYFLTDRLGSVVGVTDSAGVVTSQTRYTPANFAPPNRFYKWGNGEVRTDVGSITATAYGYTFQQVVSGSGLMDYKARNRELCAPERFVREGFDPFLQRFMQPDTVVANPYSSQGYNRYSYVNNNPVRYSDSSGHFTEEEVVDYLHNYYPEYSVAYLNAWKNDKVFWQMLMQAKFGDSLDAPTTKLGQGFFYQNGKTFSFMNGSGVNNLYKYQGYGPYELNGVNLFPESLHVHPNDPNWRIANSVIDQPLYIYTQTGPIYEGWHRVVQYEYNNFNIDIFAGDNVPYLIGLGLGLPMIAKIPAVGPVVSGIVAGFAVMSFANNATNINFVLVVDLQDRRTYLDQSTSYYH